MARKKKQVKPSNRMEKALLDENGHEIVDEAPIAPHLDMRRQPSLADRIREMVRSESIAREARESGRETFEEADDFEVGDDFDPSSPYEEEFEGQFDTRPQAAPPQAEPKAPAQNAPAAPPEPTPRSEPGSA